MTISLSNMSFLSRDSRCYSFDHRANGYARGEGFGALIIKRLSDAIQDGDSIRAVIRSTCSNQDGHTPSIAQPSKDSQAALIRATYKRAGLGLQTTRYFEAHGTGTPVGDPIEAGAIGAAFKRYRNRDEPLYMYVPPMLILGHRGRSCCHHSSNSALKFHVLKTRTNIIC